MVSVIEIYLTWSITMENGMGSQLQNWMLVEESILKHPVLRKSSLSEVS